ncbi:MAG TPA: hypothetical protein VJN72_06290 [Gaiellales bacterium]|nr:hypothetical protein [Gaiellales bacterium]
MAFFGTLDASTQVLVGTYDASTWVEGNYATYPQLPPGVTYYQPTMHWEVVGAGTIQGQHVVVGDLLFATQGDGRTYGANLYGDQVYGTNTHGDWTVDQVFFLKWPSTLPGPIRPPYPNAGCPFTRTDLPDGDWAPGWRIVIDAFYNDLTGSRTYGDDTYGAEVYGDADNSGQPDWVDITRPSFSVHCGDGTREGLQSVVVTETVVELYDETGVWLDFAEPWIWYQPGPGVSIRVGFIDPTYEYHPVITGQIERIEDVHDGDHPRVVTIRAFGQIMDLTVDVVGVQRPAELASARFNALVDLAGWRWGEGDLVFPGDTMLIADAVASAIVVRDELDRTAQSAGWFFDQDRYGGMRLRNWPHEPAGEPLHVVDCADGDDADVLVSPAITFANDQSQLLNYVIATNNADPVVEVRGEDDLSIARYGKRGRALGYPKGGLAFADQTFTAGWVSRIVNRFARITRHIEAVVADTLVDHGWLAVLADLDTGRAITVERRGLHPLTLDGVVVGFEHEITPGQWVSTLHTSTTTPTY